MPLTSLQPEAPTKLEAWPKLKTILRGTPRKGNTMANILKAVLKPTKVASPTVAKFVETPLSTSIAESMKTESELFVSLKADLDLGKERDEVVGPKDEGSKEETTSVSIEMVHPRRHEYIVVMLRGGTDCRANCRSPRLC